MDENKQNSDLENTDVVEDKDKSTEDDKLEIENTESLEHESKKQRVSIKEAFSNKRIRYGAYASTMTVAVIAIVVVLNLIVSQLNIKWDLTSNKMYSISDQTKNILSSLSTDVNIYPIYKTGSENSQFIEILNKYKEISDKIHIEIKDPDLSPAFMQKYMDGTESISSGSIIVESGNRFKVLTPYELVDLQPNYQLGEYEITAISVEPKVTSAIQYVTTDDLPIAYIVQGHNEIELNQNITKSLMDENYKVADLNVLATGKIPEDISILIANPPAYDYSEDEVEMIREYLTKGGRAIFVSALYSGEVELPNYQSLLTDYGLQLENKIIVEADPNNFFSNNRITLMPNMESHEIVNSIKDEKMKIIINGSPSIKIIEEKNASVKITPLLTTSDSSYAKYSLDATTIEKESNDISGPFNLAVLAEDSWFNDSQSYQSKIIVISSVDMLNSSFDSNLNFFMNAVNFLVDRQDSVAIRSKSLEIQPLSITAQQAIIISAIAVIVIPAIILIAGATIWFKRKNK